MLWLPTESMWMPRLPVNRDRTSRALKSHILRKAASTMCPMLEWQNTAGQDWEAEREHKGLFSTQKPVTPIVCKVYRYERPLPSPSCSVLMDTWCWPASRVSARFDQTLRQSYASSHIHTRLQNLPVIRVVFKASALGCGYDWYWIPVTTHIKRQI